mgnify:CR=1 FL=1
MIKWYKCTDKKPKRELIILFSSTWGNIDFAYFKNCSKDKKTLFVDTVPSNGEELTEWEVFAPDYFWAYASDFNFPKEKE